MRPIAALALVLAACTGPSPDTIYYNGRVWTGTLDPAAAAGETAGVAIAEAFAIKDGAFVLVGTTDAAEALAGSETERIDLEGAFVVPGFIDNHVHFLAGGFQLASVDLRSAATPEEFAARIATFAATQPAGTWITGGDWDHELWGGALPDRAWIDAITPEHPVFVSRLDGHMALANSLALEKAGVSAQTPDVAGGTIVRRPGGEPTGVLKDEAMSLVYPVIPSPSAQAFDTALARAMEHAASLGVTQVHDVGSFGGWTDLEVYRRARGESTGEPATPEDAAGAGRNALKTRIYSFVSLSTWERMRDFVQANGRGDDWLRWGALKGFVDGSLGSTTAWFYDPYVDEPETSGLLVNDTSAVRGQVLAADAAGLHVGVHAIGDRANDWLLDVYAEAASRNGVRDRRFRIEHAQHQSRAAIDRFRTQGVVPSMQPYHAVDDGRWAEKRIGPERILTTYPFRSLLDAGAPLTFGSDWTVAPMSPLLGIHAAVTRRTTDGANPGGWVPGERISVDEALHAYTVANAWAGFQEGHTGVIKAGALADFAVLSEDLRAIDPGAIPDVRVLRTVVGGVTVFAAAPAGVNTGAAPAPAPGASAAGNDSTGTR